MKTTKQRGPHVANDIVFNQARLYHEKVNADVVVSKFWIVKSFSSQHFYKFFANINSKNGFQVHTEKRKIRFLNCKVNLNFLSSSRHFNGDTMFSMIVSLLNESFHGLNKILNGGV